MNAESQLSDLKAILFELELAASRVTDTQFKQHGCTGLNTSIQKCKAMIRAAEQLDIYQQISEYSDSLEDYSGSLGIHNIA